MAKILPPGTYNAETTDLIVNRTDQNSIILEHTFDVYDTDGVHHTFNCVITCTLPNNAITSTYGAINLLINESE